MKAELHSCGAQLLGALVNGLYQGILLWLLVAFLLRWWGKANAATRHAVWFATLLLIALLIPAHYCLDARQSKTPPPFQSTPAPALPTFILETPPANPGEFGALTVEPSVAADPLALGVDLEDSQRTDLLPLGSASPEGRLAGPPELPMVGSSIGKSVTDSRSWRNRIWAFTGRLLSPVSWRPESAVGFGVVAASSLLWFMVAAARLVVLFCRLAQLKRLVRRARHPVSAELCGLFQNLLSQLKVGRAVNLRITPEQRSAVFVGLRRPTILLPEDSVTNLDEVRHVLRHELAHVQRYDDWTNLIQHLIQAILFFHPAVLWISKRLGLEREIACDDQVLQLTGSRRSYALTLANMAARIQQRTSLLAPGVSHSHSQLKQRISMILNTRRNSSPKLAKAGLASAVSLAALAAALGVYFAPRLVLAAAPAAAAPTLRSGAAILTAPAAPALAAAEPAPAAASITAEGEAPAETVAGIEPGPKFKPDAPATEPPEPSDVAPAQLLEPPVIDVAPRPPSFPRVARMGKPGRTSSSEDSVEPADNGNSSIEERLRRLEKMVRSLVDQQNGKRAHGTLSLKEGANQNWNVDQEQLDKLKDLADRQSARALEQAQRAVEQANRAKKEFAARRDDQGQDKSELREALQKQLESLRQAREGLGREMERLDRQIQKLQQDQERGDRDNSRRHGAVSGDKLHAQISADPSVAVSADADVSVTPDVTVNTEVKK